ncbi:MAG TPA: hypothetical protein VN645_09800 [Steroidobacteraceae bacterium]|nr:hypothetical protein [Steroidobacteraceae bacterium]
MGITDILIILACLAGGYWLVNSVMGPGIDITRRKPPEAPDSSEPPRAPLPHQTTPPGRPAARPPTTLLPRATNPHAQDWHVILDVPRSATRSDIEAAFRRQQKKAEASGDAFQLQRLQQAREAALAALK